MASLAPRQTVSRDDLMVHPARPRVVVAVRMHAALMAIAAGHYVVHLAYERKGFSAFADLGIGQYVHPVRRFDIDSVVAQVEHLRGEDARAQYDACLAEAGARARSEHERVVRTLREAVAR